MFQMNYAAKILECHLKLLNAIRIGGYLPDRVINLILQYLSNRSDILYGLLLINFRNLSEYEFSGKIIAPDASGYDLFGFNGEFG